MEPDWDSVNFSNYRSNLLNPRAWINVAQDLNAAAERLRPALMAIWDNRKAVASGSGDRLSRDEVSGAYYLLRAYAIENLLKAKILQLTWHEAREQVEEKRKFPKELKSHNLVRLAERAEVETSLEEEDLLRRLTRSAVWAGRYPVPLEYGHISAATTFSDGKDYSVAWMGRGDPERIDALYGRLAHGH